MTTLLIVCGAAVALLAGAALMVLGVAVWLGAIWGAERDELDRVHADSTGGAS